MPASPPQGALLDEPRPARARRGRAPQAAVAAGLVAVALLSTVAWAGRTYSNEAWRITSFEVPRGWARVQDAQVPWPGVLLIATAPANAAAHDARLVVAAQHVGPGQDPLELAAAARPALLKQGFEGARVSPKSSGGGGEPRCQIDATLDGGKRVMRQVYVVAQDVAVVMTLTAPAAAAGPSLRAFDAAVDSLALDQSIASAPPTPSAPEGPAVPAADAAVR